MKVTYSLVFNRKKKLRPDKTALVQIKAYLNGRNKYFSTQIYIAPEQWDVKNQKVKRHPNQYPLNKKIIKQVEELESYELRLSKQQKGQVNLAQLENYQTDNEYKSFSQFFMVEMGNETVSKGTKQSYFTTFQKMKQFKKSIFFEELNYELIRRFDSFLKKLGLKINTVAKHHKNMKKFINLSVKMNLLEFKDNPYRQFEIRKELTERTFLTEQEVRKIASLALSTHPNGIDAIRDMFLFSCYTGLRYSDVSRVSLEFLTKDEKGFYLKMIAKKTGKEINLPFYHCFETQKQNSFLTIFF